MSRLPPSQASRSGTKGGPQTDARARVPRWDNTAIPGLRAAGNAMAAVIGPAIISPGATSRLRAGPGLNRRRNPRVVTDQSAAILISTPAAG